ncbi:MAG: ADP-glyceromanno-heptose 6-epimerase [Candidatus Omnitrophica bacterium]|nr:ADP-glyceromanno-heptose 6-epimerase [Candidatus Omnitrophota bacterium]
MKFLVTGGAGFIGSNLTLHLEKEGHGVTVLDDFSSGQENNLKGFKGEVIRADIATFNLSSKFKKLDAIFHEAAITDTTITDEKKMFHTNVDGFQNVLDLASRIHAKVVYASSAAVYGKGPSPMKESQKSAPTNCYGASKAKMDEIAQEAMKGGKISSIIGLRYFNVFGPREEYKGSAASMIYQLAQQMKGGRRPRVFKYGEQRRDFVYVKDVMLANLLAFQSGKSGIANIGTGRATSFNEVIETLNRALGFSYGPDYFDNPYSFYQEHTEADLSFAKQLLGYHPHYTTQEGIKDYLGHPSAAHSKSR